MIHVIQVLISIQVVVVLFIENLTQILINHANYFVGEIDDDPLNSNDMYKNIYYSLAYIIRVSNPNISPMQREIKL